MRYLKLTIAIIASIVAGVLALSPAYADRPKAKFTNNIMLNTALEREPRSRTITISGHHEGVSGVLLEDIAGWHLTTGVLPVPGCIQLEMVSTSALDTGAGTGAQTVEITYLDSDNIEMQELIVMNGTTPVTTVGTDFCGIQWMHVELLGSGTNKTAAGDITLQSIGGATIYEQITAGGNQSLTARYKIPAGKVAVILDWNFTGTVKLVNFRLRVDIDRLDNILENGVFLFKDVGAVFNNVSPVIPVMDFVPTGATIKVSAISSGAGTGDGTASFRLFITDE